MSTAEHNSMLNFLPKPLPNKVLVQQLKTPEKTKQGLHLPAIAQKAIPIGVVLAVGPITSSSFQQEGLLAAGDLVWFPEFSGMGVDLRDGSASLRVLDLQDIALSLPMDEIPEEWQLESQEAPSDSTPSEPKTDDALEAPSQIVSG